MGASPSVALPRLTGTKMLFASALFAALLLDALLGEPRLVWDRLPHPAVLMGRLVSVLDRRLNHPPLRRAKGVAAVLVLVSVSIGLGALLAALPGQLAEIVVAAILLAQRSLCDHLSRTADALRLSIGAGRAEVAMIVSRDTAAMTPTEVARAAIESGAENLSDGVIAPAFWFLIGGLPGLLVYKAINTADSMIGYLTPRHAEFGWAAARLDDLLNLAPARLTALLLRVTAGRKVDWRAAMADARRHKSPNAGWPEAVLARGLDIALAGPRTYDGIRRDYPFVNPLGRHDLGPDEIDAAIRALWRAWALALALTGLLALA